MTRKVSSWREGKCSGRKERRDGAKWERKGETKRMKRRKKNFKSELYKRCVLRDRYMDG